MTMKHSIYTVLNSPYMKFGMIFIQSYLRYNRENCEYIFILDAGLSASDLKWLSSIEQVQIIKSNIHTKFENGNTSADWTKTVVAKTYGLCSLLEHYDCTPIIMIDSDCLVLQNINDLIDINYDLQICYRTNHETPMLGSYVSFNDRQRSLEFLNRWIEVIPTITTPWKESPALSKIYPEYENKFNIGLIPERIVSCFRKEDVDENVKIVHFKSGAAHQTIEESIQKRIYDRGWGELINQYNYHV